jgi:hypothetical protein
LDNAVTLKQQPIPSPTTIKKESVGEKSVNPAAEVVSKNNSSNNSNNSNNDDDNSNKADVEKEDDIMVDISTKDITFEPSDEEDERETRDVFNTNAILQDAKVPGRKNIPLEPPPYDSRKDHMNASITSLQPLKRDPFKGGTSDISNSIKKMPGALPLRDELNTAGEGPRGSIPNGLEYHKEAPPAVPDQGEVTVSTLDQFGSSYLTNYDGFDGRSLAKTIESSTYGDDRQKVMHQTLLDPYGDKGKYSGIVLRSTGMPHGPGRMVYEDDGRTYDGDWRHGRWHGNGRATFANGDTYKGEYRFDQRHGKGMYCWSDGRVFDGAFSEDKRHGKGKFKWPDGATYEGDFVQGQREGHGQYSFSDGGYYVGSWIDGRYEGFGECHWEDGRTYKGEWKSGMAHGQGVETYPDGRVRHDGQWQADEPIRGK